MKFAPLLVSVLCFGLLFAPVSAAPNEFSGDEQASISVYKNVSPAVVTVSTPVGAGAGSIVSPEGLILTNEHVIRGSQDGRVLVKTSQGKQYSGQVIAIDNQNDLALVRLQTKDRFPTVRLADAEGIQVGQKVYAIGNPFGLSGTYTTGILSRVAGNGDLQTDAALNPGNSGGPLLNSRGEVIGVNKAILSPGGQGNIGIGFATNALTARKFVAQGKNGTVLTAKRPATPQLGVTLDAQTLVIQQVTPGSLASRLGLEPGDQLLGINGQPVYSSDDLRSFLSSRPAAAVLTVARGNRLANLRVKF